jgi:xylan 1,4-beta-xylosidase
MAPGSIASALVLAVLAGHVRAGVTYPDCTSGPLKSNLVCNTSATPEARATALVAAMSNSDKLANLVKFVLPLTATFEHSDS